MCVPDETTRWHTHLSRIACTATVFESILFPFSVFTWIWTVNLLVNYNVDHAGLFLLIVLLWTLPNLLLCHHLWRLQCCCCRPPDGLFTKQQQVRWRSVGRVALFGVIVTVAMFVQWGIMLEHNDVGRLLRSSLAFDLQFVFIAIVLILRVLLTYVD